MEEYLKTLINVLKEIEGDESDEWSSNLWEQRNRRCKTF